MPTFTAKLHDRATTLTCMLDSLPVMETAGSKEQRLRRLPSFAKVKRLLADVA